MLLKPQNFLISYFQNSMGDDTGLYRFLDSKTCPDPFLTIPKTTEGSTSSIVIDNGKSTCSIVV